jgi:hypothetical protein
MRVQAKLVLTVWYDDCESTEEVRALLEQLVTSAANRGELSGEGPATVDTYDSKVTAREV